jgi:hypothetical protein
MNVDGPTDLFVEQQSLAERLRTVGILLVGCDVSGVIVVGPSRGEDWLVDLCCHSPMLQRAVQRAASRWNQQEDPETIEITPGLWVKPLPVVVRRRRVAYSLGMVVTGKLLSSEYLVSICNSAGMDLQLTEKLLADLPPASVRDVDRLLKMVRHAHEDQQRMRGDIVAVESIGRQLAESYEEINLLYTIIQSMSVVQRPQRFVQLVCDELLKTMPYRWVGAQFAPGHPWIKSIAGRLIKAGTSGRRSCSSASAPESRSSSSPMSSQGSSEVGRSRRRRSCSRSVVTDSCWEFSSPATRKART